MEAASVMVRYWQAGRDPRTALIGVYDNLEVACELRDWLRGELGRGGSGPMDTARKRAG